MNRIGIIDNLVNIQSFLEQEYHSATAAEVMVATGGNTGNVAFVFGARQLIKNPVVRVGWGWPPEVVRQHVDQLVVCCANQIGAHADLGGWADRLEQFSLPVTLIGLGAQSESYDVRPVVPEGTARFLNLVKNLRPDVKEPNIGVRGEFTQKSLSEFGVESVRTGCPSLLISSEKELGKKILRKQSGESPKKVAVAAGNPWHGPSAFLERVLVDVVDRYNGAYVLQHPESMLQVAYGEVENVSEKTIDRFLQIYGDRFDLKGMFDWYRRNAYAFVDVPNWMRFLASFDAVIGPRYHGVALAVQKAVPGCVLTIDSRTEELCMETSIKAIRAADLKDIGLEELIDVSRWTGADAEAFDQNRKQKANRTLDFLRSNKIEPTDHLITLAQ